MYKGYFRDGKKHGHGLFTQGSLMQSSVASLYIGEWINDKKQGYGVFDDVSKGERERGRQSIIGQNRYSLRDVELLLHPQ